MKHQDFETTASQSSLPNSGHSIRERNQHSVMQEIEERKDIKGNSVVLETMLRRRTKKKKKHIQQLEQHHNATCSPDFSS